MFVRAAAAQENVNFQYTTARIPIFSYVLHNSAHEWVINEYCAVVQEPLQNVVDDCCLLLINISRAEGRKKERSRGNFGNKNVFNVGGFGKLSWIKKFNLWQIDFKDQTDKLTNSIRISHYDFFPPLKFDFLLSWVAKKKEREEAVPLARNSLPFIYFDKSDIDVEPNWNLSGYTPLKARERQ